MKRCLLVPLAIALALLTSACGALPFKLNTAQWQRNECGKLIDLEDRNRCLRRVELANPPDVTQR